MRRLRAWPWFPAFVLGGVLLSGCVTGRLYTHVVTPLDVNFDGTPVTQRMARDDSKRFQYRVRVEWGDEAIGKIARQNGLRSVHYADLETRSFLGIWTQRWVRIYGE